MAKQKKVTVNGTEHTLQSVSLTWYFNHNGEYGVTGGKRKTVNYIDGLTKNVAILPKEVSTQGVPYFEEVEDISTPERLITEIESLPRGRKGYREGTDSGDTQPEVLVVCF